MDKKEQQKELIRNITEVMQEMHLMGSPTVFTTPEKPPAPFRKPELYKGDPPVNPNGKFPTQWPINEICGLEYEKGKRCDQRIIVVRVKNTKFQKDSAGFGGQLIYDDADVRQYKVCPIHTPKALIEEHWE